MVPDFKLYPAITRESFEACRTDGRPHRVCFATTHADQPRRSTKPPYIGTFNVPFFETVGVLIREACGIELSPNRNFPGAYWRSIRSEDEFGRIADWVRSQGTRVFLRDCLDLSIALDFNFRGNGESPEGHTPLGELEHRAKNQEDESAISALVTAFCEAIRDLPCYQKAKLIAAVPPRPGKDYDLPATLTSRIAARLALADLTARFTFSGVKGTVKATRFSEKWAAWEQGRLTFTPPLTGRPSVILIDDKYQSGVSIHYVASQLRAAGAGEIYGLCAVKTWRDTDNA